MPECRAQKDAQLMSLSAQISYYSAYIQKRPDWEYAGVYADEALTGTKDNRAFQRLLKDCRAGNIDMVITKSISHFAWNTVTILESVRELKSLGIDVYFEKENIHSMSGDGELMLTILASYAQEESRSASENRKWRIRKNFKEGKPSNHIRVYGNDYHNGSFAVIPQEAEVVRMIYADYLGGMGRNAIMKKLMSLGVPTKNGGRWSESYIASILQNEKYVGAILLQKGFISDHLTKRWQKNNGELPQYYVDGTHQAILDRETFAAVQTEIVSRAAQHHPSRATPNRYPFTGKIICGQCGKNYRRKVANAGGKYEKPVWICATFNNLGKNHCSSQQIPENILLNLTASVLGLTEFDETVFEKKISQIIIPEPGRVNFLFESGHKIDKLWQNPSRRESWSDKMREQARQTALKGRGKSCRQSQRQE